MGKRFLVKHRQERTFYFSSLNPQGKSHLYNSPYCSLAILRVSNLRSLPGLRGIVSRVGILGPHRHLLSWLETSHRERWGWGAELSSVLAPTLPAHLHLSLCLLKTQREAGQEQAPASPIVQASESCHYAMSLPQFASSRLFLTCSRNKGWIATFNKENPILLCQHPIPPHPLQKKKSHFLVVFHLATLSVVLKQLF